MVRRMAIAVLALVGFFIALYLTLFKLGVIGQLTCGVGSCDTVNLSAWGSFLGLPVAAWGMGYYALLFAVAFAGAHDGWASHPMIPRLLVLLAGWGLLFSAYLTYLELFVIHAICMWCVISAVLVVTILALTVWDYRATAAVRPA